MPEAMFLVFRLESQSAVLFVLEKWKVNGNHETGEKRRFCNKLTRTCRAECYFAPPGHHASHHRLLSFESAQSLLALFEQRALCTFFSLLPQASLHCCGLMVSSPGPCASSGGRLPEALFMVFLLDSKGANACRSRQSFQTSI